MSEDSFELSKSDVRGRRSNKGATKKQERHSYDDESQERHRKQAGKRKHSKFHEEPAWVLDNEDYEDSPYEDFIDPKMIK